MNVRRILVWGALATLVHLLAPAASQACFKPKPPGPPPEVCFKTGIIPGTTTTQMAIGLGTYFGTTTQNCSCGVAFAGPGALPIPVGARIAVVNFNTCTVDVGLTTTNLPQFYSAGSSVLARTPGADAAWATGVDMMGGSSLLPGATWFGFAGQPSAVVPPGGLPALPPGLGLAYALVFDLGAFSVGQTSSLRVQIGSGGGQPNGNPNFLPGTGGNEVAIYGGVVPEPASVLLMGLGLGAVGLVGRRAWTRVRPV